MNINSPRLADVIAICTASNTVLKLLEAKLTTINLEGDRTPFFFFFFGFRELLRHIITFKIIGVNLNEESTKFLFNLVNVIAKQITTLNLNKSNLKIDENFATKLLPLFANLEALKLESLALPKTIYLTTKVLRGKKIKKFFFVTIRFR